MNQLALQEFLDELCPRLRPAMARVVESPCCCAALEFFRYRPSVWLEVEDIAYHLRQDTAQVGSALNVLTEIGFVKQRKILGSTFYALASEEEILSALEQFWLVSDDWHRRALHAQHVMQALGRY